MSCYILIEIMADRVVQMQKVQTEALELFRKKNTDYGDSFATYGPVGVLVRMGDKISRLSSITKSGVNLVNTESLRDTLIDLHNYAAMGIMLLDDRGPDVARVKNQDNNTQVWIRDVGMPKKATVSE